MMYSDIILLTKHFPFNNGQTPGETFLESEISILSEQAERVIVFTADVRQGAVPTVDLPDNVAAVPLQRRSVKAIKISSILNGFQFFFDAPKEVCAEANGRSFMEKLFLYYFISRANQKLSRIRAWCRQKNSFGDKVLIYSYWFYDFARAAVMLRDDICCSGRKVTCISRAHGYDLYEYNNRFDYLPMRPWLLEKLDNVFPCSRDGTKYLISKYGNPNGKIKTVYLGTRDYGTGKWTKQTPPCLVSCSRIVPLKRIERIINALELLEKQNMTVRWTHIGGGEGLDALKSECQRRLHLSKVVFAGNMPNADVLNYYRSSNIDAFLNVSENEGLPISIMEAVSFGIPVIATDVGGTSEIVKNDVNGIILDKDFTDDELANAIRRLLFMSEIEFLKMRANARRIWEEGFKFQNNSLYMLEKTGEHVESS